MFAARPTPPFFINRGVNAPPPDPNRRRAARARPRIVLALLAAAAAACGGAGPPALPAAARRAMPVEAVTLAERPVEQTTEFVGHGQVAAVDDRAAPGRGLRHPDPGPLGRPRAAGNAADADRPGMQQAAVASLESQRAGREADLRYAQQEAARTKTLLEAGAASQAELEQAADRRSPRPRPSSQAAEAQIREQSVALGYHRVSAPTAGVVGDIPVRVGDRVTHSTVLTTIDQNAGLEVYVNVPVQEAAAAQASACPSTSSTTRAGCSPPRQLSFVVARRWTPARSRCWPRPSSSRRRPAAPSSSCARESSGPRRRRSPFPSWP